MEALTDGIFGLLQKKLREDMNTYSDEVLTNRLPLEEYRRIQGVIEGLARAERHVLDLEIQDREAR